MKQMIQRRPSDVAETPEPNGQVISVEKKEQHPVQVAWELLREGMEIDVPFRLLRKVQPEAEGSFAGRARLLNKRDGFSSLWRNPAVMADFMSCMLTHEHIHASYGDGNRDDVEAAVDMCNSALTGRKVVPYYEDDFVVVLMSRS